MSYIRIQPRRAGMRGLGFTVPFQLMNMSTGEQVPNGMSALSPPAGLFRSGDRFQLIVTGFRDGLPFSLQVVPPRPGGSALTAGLDGETGGDGTAVITGSVGDSDLGDYIINASLNGNLIAQFFFSVVRPDQVAAAVAQQAQVIAQAPAAAAAFVQPVYQAPAAVYQPQVFAPPVVPAVQDNQYVSIQPIGPAIPYYAPPTPTPVQTIDSGSTPGAAQFTTSTNAIPTATPIPTPASPLVSSTPLAASALSTTPDSSTVQPLAVTPTSKTPAPAPASAFDPMAFLQTDVGGSGFPMWGVLTAVAVGLVLLGRR